MAGNLTNAKFQDDFKGYDFTEGRIFHFPIDFCMGLTAMERDCVAVTSWYYEYRRHTRFESRP